MFIESGGGGGAGKLRGISDPDETMTYPAGGGGFE